MTDYTELVKELRHYSEVAITVGVGELVCDAATAIEALQAELDKYHELCDVDEIPEVLEILMTV